MSFQNDIKPYFVTGKFPTQSQFWEVFAKGRWKDENIAINEITGLQDILNGLAVPVESFTSTGVDLTYTIPVGYMLEDIIVNPVSDSTLRCTSEGSIVAGDIILDDDVTAAKGAVWQVKIFAPVARNIVLIGLPIGSKAYFIKRKIY